jgi:hypothetical protein
VAHTWNPSLWEAEAGGLRVQDQPTQSEFETSLGYLVRLYLKTEGTKGQGGRGIWFAVTWVFVLFGMVVGSVPETDWMLAICDWLKLLFVTKIDSLGCRLWLTTEEHKAETALG